LDSLDITSVVRDDCNFDTDNKQKLKLMLNAGLVVIKSFICLLDIKSTLNQKEKNA